MNIQDAQLICYGKVLPVAKKVEFYSDLGGPYETLAEMLSDLQDHQNRKVEMQDTEETTYDCTMFIDDDEVLVFKAWLEQDTNSPLHEYYSGAFAGYYFDASVDEKTAGRINELLEGAK